MNRIARHKIRLSFYNRFHDAPVEMINILLASQTKDLATLTNSLEAQRERQRFSKFYLNDLIKEGVYRYTSKLPKPEWLQYPLQSPTTFNNRNA